MGSKKKPMKPNGTVIQNGKKAANGTSERKRKTDDSTTATRTVQISAFIVIIIASIIMYRTDFSSNKSSEQLSSPSKSSQNSKSQNSQNSEQAESSNNWRPATREAWKLYGSTKCTIERREAKGFTAKEFEDEYRFKKPVIVKFSQGAKGWTDPKKWSLMSLKREYGQWYVLSGNSREIVRKGGNGDVQSSFSEFVDSLMQDKDEIGEPLYVYI
jgi:hypothetical protein